MRRSGRSIFFRTLSVCGFFCDEKPNFNSSGLDLKAYITKFKGKLLGDWRNTLEKRPEQKDEAPTKSWFEAGELPKAGECCEHKFQNPDVSWQIVQVNYISEKHAILTILDDGNECHADSFKAADFRPVRTDKEKAIDAAARVCTGVNIATTTDSLTMKTLNKLYDAGLLRLPDNKRPD